MKTVAVPVWPLVAGLAALSMGLTAQTPIPTTITPRERAILSKMSLVQLPDGQGGFTETLRIAGVNVQIVNGLGATNGNPSNPGTLDAGLTVTNGVGNLIVGYNETDGGSDRTGSHCIVVGRNNDYSSFGGFVGGTDNDLLAAASMVSGGFHNVASGERTVVVGGEDNATAGPLSTVCGGLSNRANGLRSSILGGRVNVRARLQ